ncbi:MAG: hypothetical protein LBM01_01070 [Christensenellaceae bacterium]|nr:hypothetical protein [Christensenellaceae bacterium]
MINAEIFEKINEAERNALQIIADAEARANAIEAETIVKIEKMREENQTKVSAEIKVLKEKAAAAEGVKPADATQLKVDKKKMEEAKKFILAEFKKRYL